MPLNPYYGTNYIVLNTGATAPIAADGVYDATEGGTLYVQYFKASFGASGSYTSVSSTNPLPVTISSGLTATVSGFSGTMNIQGVASGTPVPVSGTVYVQGLTYSPVYVQTAACCYVEITGGIPLTRTRDAVSVYGPSGNTYVYTQIVNTAGTIIGTTSNPLSVSFSGVTITGNIVSPIGVTNDSATSALRVQGLSGGTSLAVTVGNTVGINDTALLASLSGICASLGTLNSSIASIAGVVPSSFKSGSISVTSSATQLDSSGFTCSDGVKIKAASTNTSNIFMGNTSGISTSGSSAYIIYPGEETELKINNTNKIYLISTTTSTAYYIAS